MPAGRQNFEQEFAPGTALRFVILMGKCNDRSEDIPKVLGLAIPDRPLATADEMIE
jgi:hypothetical protein